MANPELPDEVSSFSEVSSPSSVSGKSLGELEQLHKMELKDVGQQIRMRPMVAIFFAFLLFLQTYIIFQLIAWALEHDQMKDLQLIFTVLVGGTLTQSYKISELIVNKLFEPIDYADKNNRFDDR